MATKNLAHKFCKTRDRETEKRGWAFLINHAHFARIGTIFNIPTIANHISLIGPSIQAIVMDTAPGEGWADAVSKILRMGKNNPESNRILSKAKRDRQDDESGSDEGDSDSEVDTKSAKMNPDYKTFRLKPQAQPDALKENELKSIATRGVVHLFNAVKTVNPKSDKKRKKKKKKKTKKHMRRRVKS